MIPPLSVNKEQIDYRLDILDSALAEYEAELKILVKKLKQHVIKESLPCF
jgi:4-aminobutyrate aminotransferase